MKSPFLEKMKKKQATVIEKNINLGQFKDQLIQYLTALRYFDDKIVDVDFGAPVKNTVPLKVYLRKDVEDQVDKTKSGKKR